MKEICCLIVLSILICNSYAATLKFDETKGIDCLSSCSFFRSDIWIPPQIPTSADTIEISYWDDPITIVIDQGIELAESLSVNGIVILQVNTYSPVTVANLTVTGNATVEVTSGSYLESPNSEFYNFSSLLVFHSTFVVNPSSVESGHSIFDKNTKIVVINSQFQSSGDVQMGFVKLINSTFNSTDNFGLIDTVEVLDKSVFLGGDMFFGENFTCDSTSSVLIAYFSGSSHIYMLGHVNISSAWFAVSNVLLSGINTFGHIFVSINTRIDIINSITVIGGMDLHAAGNISIDSSSDVRFGSHTNRIEWDGDFRVAGFSTVFMHAVILPSSTVTASNTTAIVISNLVAEDLPANALQLLGSVTIEAGGVCYLHNNEGKIMFGGSRGVFNYGNLMIEECEVVMQKYEQAGDESIVFFDSCTVISEVFYFDGRVEFSADAVLNGIVSSRVPLVLLESYSTLNISGNLYLTGGLDIPNLAVNQKTPLIHVSNEFQGSGGLTFYTNFDQQSSISVPILYAGGALSGGFEVSQQSYSTKIENSILYLTFDPAPPAIPKNNNAAIIAGSVVGGVVGIAIIIGGIVFWRKRAAKSRDESQPILGN